MKAICRNELYAKLVELGSRKGYAVIPEFKFKTTPRSRNWKYIDLVWARKRPRRLARQPCESLCLWEIFATFEIEGCNVPYQRIQDHVEALSMIRKPRGLRERSHHIVLYSAAYDRKNWLDSRQVEAATQRRQEHFAHSTVSVIDGSSLKAISGFQRAKGA